MMRELDILLAEQHPCHRPPLSITACLSLLQNSRNTTSSPAARFPNMSHILATLILRGKIAKLKFKLFRTSGTLTLCDEHAVMHPLHLQL